MQFLHTAAVLAAVAAAVTADTSDSSDSSPAAIGDETTKPPEIDDCRG